MGKKSKDADKLAVLDQKFEEIAASRKQILAELGQLNGVLQAGVQQVSGGQGTDLASAFKSITTFFQSSVNMMASLSKQLGELNQLMLQIKSKLDGL
ncbi:MAG: hypothetical protein Kow0069_06560 [Promethearchaeota archaeon]